MKTLKDITVYANASNDGTFEDMIDKNEVKQEIINWINKLQEYRNADICLDCIGKLGCGCDGNGTFIAADDIYGIKEFLKFFGNVKDEELK